MYPVNRLSGLTCVPGWWGGCGGRFGSFQLGKRLIHALFKITSIVMFDPGVGCLRLHIATVAFGIQDNGIDAPAREETTDDIEAVISPLSIPTMAYFPEFFSVSFTAGQSVLHGTG